MGQENRHKVSGKTYHIDQRSLTAGKGAVGIFCTLTHMAVVYVGFYIQNQIWPIVKMTKSL